MLIVRVDPSRAPTFYKQFQDSKKDGMYKDIDILSNIMDCNRLFKQVIVFKCNEIPPHFLIDRCCSFREKMAQSFVVSFYLRSCQLL